MQFKEGGTSSAMSKNEYEVFLSFRESDIPIGLVDCIYHAMVDAGIHVVRDDDEIRVGENATEIWLNAVYLFKFCVVIFSRAFVESAWCLHEVEKMVSMKKVVVPIYYNVTPDDVKLNTGLYVDALIKHETKYGKVVVQQWREALKEISSIKGHELKNSRFVEFSWQLTREILTRLKLINKFGIRNLVEMTDEVEDAVKLLNIGSRNMRFLGIHGMGGLGKTTLAKIIFNQIVDYFECSCFLEQIQDYLSQGQDGLHKLQVRLLKSLDPSLRDATKIFDPLEKIKRILRRKRVIIVLDDIDQENQIRSLVGDYSSFASGSRIIFTTKNIRLHEQKTSYDVEFYGLEKKVMDSKQALNLFSKHAFGADSPPEDYKDLSSQVISTTGGLPLALEVVGSFLYRRKVDVWRDTVKKLEEAPFREIQQKLKPRYDALESEEQEIFLDIACFFIGEEKTNALYIWEACGFHPEHSIDVLISMSFIKMKDEKYFWMHDQLRDFGRAIVRENSKDPKAGTRLWMHKDALDLLKRNWGREKVEALHLDGPSVDLDRTDFVGLEKLRFLRLRNLSNFSGDFGGLFPKLRWLSLHDVLSFSVTNFCLRELVVLELYSFRFDETWQGWSQILVSPNLKVLTLSGCSGLTSTPNLSKLVNLERLVLHDCENLTYIHSSLGKLQHIKHLDITKCHSFHELPEEFTSLEGPREISAGGEPSYATSKTNHEVFLSFRGPDTRQGFTDCLYHAMVNAGVHVFRDDDELRPGDKLFEILQAIDNSKICVVVLSRTFAVSSWCLCEVERMLKMKKDIVPIFYDVKPDDLKLKTPLYTDVLTSHEIKYGKEQVQKWKEAMYEIASIKGLELKNAGYAKSIQQLAKLILTKLRANDKYVIKNLVEVPYEVEDALKLLDTASGGRRLLSIHGIAGIGKTTLAKIIFNQIYGYFDHSCFLENIREISFQGRDGLRYLQELLLRSLDPSLRDKTQIVVDPMKMIQTVFRRKKVLIVLDGIDKRNYIDGLIGDSTSFGIGSRIIFTTRCASFHDQETSSNACFYTFEKKELDPKEALKLFSKNAFRQDSPPKDFKDLSSEVLATIGGHPLLLEEVGSSLHHKKSKIWRDMIKRLKEAPHQIIQQSLKLSFDALEPGIQEIFLDIACFFTGQDKTNAIYMWEACGYHPYYGIEELNSMSLIKLNDKKFFWMHDHVREFGRATAKENSRGGCRLSIHKNAFDLLKRNAGKEMVEALHLSGPIPNLDGEDFVGFEKLRLLRITNHANVSGDFNGLLRKLKWLSLSDASSFNPTNLCLEELVVLQLSQCRCHETWGGWSQILISENLKVLTLSGCRELSTTPDLSKVVNLERLVLDNCEKLDSIHSSVEKLSRLKHLTIRGCHSLHKLPEELTSLEDVKHISCPPLGSPNSHLNLPESIGYLVSLTRLELSNTSVTKLPYSLGELVKLKSLMLDGCKSLNEIPDSIGGLESLVTLNLSWTGITKIPTTIGRLAKLESLCLSWCQGLECLPNSIGNLHSLTDLNASQSSIIELPDSFTKLGRLEYLDMADSSLERLPDSFGDIKSLRKLTLERSRVKILPDSIACLENLEELTVGGGGEGEWIEELPKLPVGLTVLKVHRVKKIPDLSNLTNLSDLVIGDGEFGKSPEQLEASDLKGIEKLKKLKSLSLSCSNVKSIPMEFSVLQLKLLILRCPNLELMPPELPPGLASLTLHVKPKAQQLINLSKLKNLAELTLVNFVMGADGFKNLGIEGLEYLETLEIEGCSIDFTDLIVLGSLRNLSLKECHSLRKFDIPQLDRLISLTISDCKEVVEIPGIGELKSLRDLEITNCHSLLRIEDLYELKELERIKICNCSNFRGIDGIDKLRSAGTVSVVIGACNCSNVNLS